MANSEKGNWLFAVDGDEGVELQVDNTIVASYYTCHGAAGACGDATTTSATPCSVTQQGTINLNTSGYHRLIVRHTERTGH